MEQGGTKVTDLAFSADEVLRRAKGNQTAVWYVSLAWAKNQAGGLDGWASFIGEQFAPSWDELGDDTSALEVARQAALNFATSADMQPIDLSGDDSRAVLSIAGPDQEWVDQGASAAELDRAYELVYSAIAKRRGLTLGAARTDGTLRLTFARRD
jgi:hypothetical protein